MKVGIVIGSVREGRISDRIAKWVENEAKNSPTITSEIVDLKDLSLPLFDEPVSPQYNPDRQTTGDVKKWLDKVASFDALVLVTPEYNRSYSAALKNALDYLAFEVKRKPVMLVSHGVTGGAQAVSHLRAVLPGLGSITIPTAVMINGRAGELINENGEANEEVKNNPYGPQASLKNALEELEWYSDALSSAS